MKKPFPFSVNSLLFILAAVSGASTIFPQVRGTVRMAEKPLREFATKSVMPDYPEQSRRSGIKGVAVAQLDIDEKGNVTRVDVLEAPDLLIKIAVERAAKEWKFKRATINNGQPVRLVGKLTFYYVNDGKRARVESPPNLGK